MLGELKKRLENLGLKYEYLSGGRLCVLDSELNSGVCFYYDMNGDVYKVVVETEYIGDRNKFKELLKEIRRKYGLGKDVDVEVKVRDYVWFDDVLRKIGNKKQYMSLGRTCVFDDDLDAEVCFDLGIKYGRDVVRAVKVKTKFIGGKEKFKEFLNRLRKKYGLTRTVKVDVITVPEKELDEVKWWYEKV